MDDMLTMEPPPVLSISLTAYLVPRNTPVALTSMMRRQPSVSSGSETRPLLRPALFTRISSLPKLATVCWTRLRQLSSLVTSFCTNKARPPASAICDSTFLPSSSFMSATTTLAPSLPKSRASSAPMPRAAPVIIATLFSSRISPPPTFLPSRRSHPRKLLMA